MFLSLNPLNFDWTLLWMVKKNAISIGHRERTKKKKYNVDKVERPRKKYNLDKVERERERGSIYIIDRLMCIVNKKICFFMI